MRNVINLSILKKVKLCSSMQLCYTYSKNTVEKCGSASVRGLKTTTILIRTKTSVNLVKTKEKLHESS